MGISELPTFSDACASLLKKHLTQTVWEEIRGLKTASGYTTEALMRSGLEQPDSAIGIYAGDAESYTLFAPLIDPIIAHYHGNPGPHPKHDLSTETLPFLSPMAKARVLSTRIRVGRNLAGFPLGPAITQEQRHEVERLITQALPHLPEALKGTYHPLSGMPETVRDDLVARHLLFKSTDRFLTSAGLMRHWPEARGLFLSHDERFSIWVNEEDQLRIIALEKGGEIAEVIACLTQGIAALSRHLSFLATKRLGYLTSCPTNLGTAMRASVHMALHALAADEATLKKNAAALGLQVRGIHGEHSQGQGGVYDISNRRRLGITERESLTRLIEGINCLAEMDERHPRP